MRLEALIGDTRASPETKEPSMAVLVWNSRHYSVEKYATAKVGNEVRAKSSVSEMPRRERTKYSWTKEENRKLWECYLQSISQRKCVIERECMGSGSRRE